MTARLSSLARAVFTREIRFDIDLIPLRLERVSPAKLLNWLLTETSVYVKPSYAWGLPTILQVEPTARCNLQCQVCPAGYGLDRPVGDMDPALFRRLVDDLRGSLLAILFWDWGEPFFNPASYEMIRYARESGIRVVSSTNGHVFADAEHARQVVASGLDVLVVSVDGITQESYEQYRGAGSLDTVLAGIRNVVAEKRRRGAGTPLVNLRFIVMKHGEPELPRLPEFARSLGLDVLTLRKFYPVPDPARRSPYQDEDLRLSPAAERFQLPRLTGAGGGPVRAARNPCRNLWNCPTVHWDGTVCSCFMDFRESRPLGSLRTQSFREIWRGEGYRRLRRQFRSRWQNLPLCSVCASGFEGGDVGREANAEAIFFRPENRAQPTEATSAQ